MKISTKLGALLLAVAAKPASAIELNVLDPESIKSVARTIAYGLLTYYTGNVTNTPETIAILPPPHYWWQAGAMWGLLLDYYHFTNDPTYNEITTQALLSQVGPQNDYMMPLYELQEANDDQAFWGFATMSAAEKGYPEPATGGYTWLQLTENLWNTQVRRWDDSSCQGGLKWQIFDFNKGYFYKNSVSNGAFFQISARLARYTGNQTYLDWAQKTWDWEAATGLISPEYHVFDGSDSKINCREINHIEWSYNLGIHLYGAAMLYDLTKSDVWAKRTQGLLDASAFFFSPYDNATNVMYEYACEPVHTCNYDQFSFKGYLSRFMWATTLLAPFTKERITTLLTTSAQAAANSCSGPRDGVTCGAKWYTGGWDGTWGAGQQMSALETIQGLLIQNSAPPKHARAPPVEAAPLPTTTVNPPLRIPTPAETSKEAEPTPGKPSQSSKRADSISSSMRAEPTKTEPKIQSSTSEEPTTSLEPTTSSTSEEPTTTEPPKTTSSSSEELTTTPEPITTTTTTTISTTTTTSKTTTTTSKTTTSSTSVEPTTTEPITSSTILTISTIHITTSEASKSSTWKTSLRVTQTREELIGISTDTSTAAAPTREPPESLTAEGPTRILTSATPSPTGDKSIGARTSMEWGVSFFAAYLGALLLL